MATTASDIRLFEWRVRYRCDGNSLLMVKAAP